MLSRLRLLFLRIIYCVVVQASKIISLLLWREERNMRYRADDVDDEDARKTTSSNIS